MNKQKKCALWIILLLFLTSLPFNCFSKKDKFNNKIGNEINNQNQIKPENYKTGNILFKYNVNKYRHKDENLEENYRILKDTVKFYFCFAAGYCDYKYSLNVKSDTLEIIQYCDKKTAQLRKGMYCVDCEMYGLKQGTYFIKTIIESKKISIF